MGGKKTIFLTGASGNMGRATMAQLLTRLDRFRVRMLVLPRESDRRSVAPFLKHEGVEAVWGDLTRYEDVAAGLKGADYVLHVGGMVSPLADRLPELTTKVNIGAARNIVRAIHEEADPRHVRLVYIGTVAQTGSRMAPIHWGRTGDPIKISLFDNYAVTKTQAEAIVAESGVTHWVSLRQSGMAYPDMWRLSDPIMFHNPIDGVFEWSTAEDSGRLMAEICEDGVPDGLWRDFYNIGGGEAWRLTNRQFSELMFSAMGGDWRRVLAPDLSATRNFHGQWYSDSDHLQTLVPFRRQTPGQLRDQMARSVPPIAKLVSRHAPGLAAARIRKLAQAPEGPLHWRANGDTQKLDAYFGSTEAFDGLPKRWEDWPFQEPSRTPTRLEHGYDETKAKDGWTAADLKQAAAFRGGALMGGGTEGPHAPARWRCARGHAFKMSPNLMLRGGHWCPTCMINPATYPEAAARSPFFAQVWSQAADDVPAT